MTMRLLILSGSSVGRGFKAEKGSKSFDIVAGVGFVSFQGLSNAGVWTEVRKTWISAPHKIVLSDNYDVWRLVASQVVTDFEVYCDDAQPQGQIYQAEVLGAS